MSYSDKFIEVARKVLPSPFTIAVLLTFVTIALAWLFTSPAKDETTPHFLNILSFWSLGFWELLEFSVQMILILVLGHVLALTKPVNRLIQLGLRYCTNTANSALIVSFLTLSLSFVNWGLGLIFGAIFARKVAENAIKKDIKINYPLVGAAGYAGLMVWHGGLSGSAPVIISMPKHFLVDQIDIISLQQTIFSQMNIVASIVLLIVIPAALYLFGKRSKSRSFSIKEEKQEYDDTEDNSVGAERLDHSRILAYVFASLIIGIGIYQGIINEGGRPLSFLTLNYINFILLGTGLLLHGTFHEYLKAINKAISGAAGILIQFPLYAGIMGIMKYSGLVVVFSDFFIQISNTQTFPLFTFISAAIVNVFVPSGGGQWIIQGPVIMQAATDLGVSIEKTVMAFAYGDQLTNMMQPFWALPLLAITGLKAKEILPYTLLLMLIGAVIFLGVLILF